MRTKTVNVARLILTLACVALLAACGNGTIRETPPSPFLSLDGEATVAAPVTGRVTVFAASSLTDAFTEIAAAFEAAHPDVRVQLNFAGSSTLSTQLVEGAPADVFASADGAQMQRVLDEGLMTTSQHVFATNKLTVITPTRNPAGIASPLDLAEPGIKLVLAARGVPVRTYSDIVISNLGDAVFFDAVMANLVSEEENVRLVVTKIALGEADAGIVYTSDVTPGVASDVQQIAIPDEDNVIARYPVGLLDGAPNPAAAQAFVDFLLSGEAQAILQQWGFGPAD